ncbi:hypothetical protein DFP72DRAFT_1149996 [Ephemerocybe angulata]|uniref:Uncharacterized protein n=1 Tax=Ephemerocybe angulata TaxID=980116 RepID=A0A8H6HHK5_9AGAR|nr:hypothetical protein DFP72DRAFT_1149996 [Tulosesus angulatus]
MAKGEAKASPKYTCTVSGNLEGLDEAWQILTPFFEQTQLVSVETANPTLDILTFAHSTHYFGILGLERRSKDKMKSRSSRSPNRSRSLSLSLSRSRSPTQRGMEALFEDEDDAPAAAASPNQDHIMAQESGEASSPSSDHKFGAPRNKSQAEIDSEYASAWATPAGAEYESPSMVQPGSSDRNYDDYCAQANSALGCRGYGKQAVRKALEIAFRDQCCQRVQAIIVDSPYKDRALSMFMKCGLTHEGVRKRGFRSPYDMTFKDVTYLGILATDYSLRTMPGRTWDPAPKSMWDELFARHQREREELLQWEERMTRSGGLKRSSSTETIRMASDVRDAGASADSQYASDSEREDMVTDREDYASASEGEADSEAWSRAWSREWSRESSVEPPNVFKAAQAVRRHQGRRKCLRQRQRQTSWRELFGTQREPKEQN